MYLSTIRDQAKNALTLAFIFMFYACTIFENTMWELELKTKDHVLVTSRNFHFN